MKRVLLIAYHIRRFLARSVIQRALRFLYDKQFAGAIANTRAVECIDGIEA